jgi:hypothetical protein
MHTMGSDFEWESAPCFYKNLDKLINYINPRSDYQMVIKYSTPSIYLEVNWLININSRQSMLKIISILPKMMISFHMLTERMPIGQDTLQVGFNLKDKLNLQGDIYKWLTSFWPLI